MSKSASSPPAAAAPVSALADRNIWLLSALGLATGLPAGAAWYGLFPDIDATIEHALLLSLTGLGLIGIVELLAGPFLDRYKAPLFPTHGHRRSWLASSLTAALALTAVYAVAAAISPNFGAALGTVFKILLIPVMGLLWISLDALRIELRPGRAQAVAFGAQYIGALAGAALASGVGGTVIASPLGLISVVLLAVGLVAALLIDEPAPPAGAPDAARGILATLMRPWSDFFARHGAAAKLLLAAIALYALGASMADYLGKQGYIVDIIAAGRDSADRGGADRDAIGAARLAMSSLELAFMLLGALAGMAVAGRFAPARAFAMLQYAVIALIAFFIACKLTLGFTVITVAGLFALRTLVFSFGGVIFAVVAARLTARPYTAGQFALLVLFVALFWISEIGLNRLAPMVGSLAVSAAGIVAAVLALVCMRSAARAVRRPVDRA